METKLMIRISYQSYQYYKPFTISRLVSFFYRLPSVSLNNWQNNSMVGLYDDKIIALINDR